MKHIYFLMILTFIASSLYGQNYGLLLNGVDENLVVTHKDAHNVEDAFTIEAWIYANNWKANQWQGSILNKDGQGPDRGYAFRCGDNGKLSFVIQAEGGWNEVFTSSIMNTDQWHHVAVVIDNKVMTLFIDGQAVATSSYTGDYVISTLPLNIGASPGFGDRFFDGIIDEVRIWNIARTATELAENSRVDLTGSENGLVAYYPMNEGSGTQATNLVDANCSAAFSQMDESNWVDGYAIPEFDVSVNPLKGIDVYAMKTRPILMSVDLKNLGTEPIDDITIDVLVNGVSVATENISQAIPVSEVLSYNIETPIDLIGLVDPELTITATQTNDQNMLNNSKTLNVNTLDGSIVRLFNQEQHNFGGAGQNQFSEVILPTDLSNFEQLILHINVNCPSGGCDPWDQPAKVSATTDEGTFEIARYITPFGIACGNWVVDVTDFKEVLGGPVNFNSYVQVWGPNGWLVTIDLELIEGNDAMPYRKLTPMWERDYVTYGDPDISHDLDPVSINVDDNTEASQIRMTITGHGQGNTDNAAEFSRKTNDFMLNGSMFNQHELWKADCAANACSNQQGTWLFDRAGWCPGQEVQPYWVNTTADAAAGSTVELDYELEDYTNLLNTGYNDSGHTEPHFRIWSYFVEMSSNPYKAINNLRCDSIVPIVNGVGSSGTLDGVMVYISNTGTETIENPSLSYFINGQKIVTENPIASLAPNTGFSYNFNLIDGFTPDADNVFYGLVASDADENTGDNVSKAIVLGSVNVTDVDLALADIKVFPNPSNNGVFYLELDEKLIGATLEVSTINGALIEKSIVESLNKEVTLNDNGIYVLSLIHESGKKENRKLVVAK